MQVFFNGMNTILPAEQGIANLNPMCFRDGSFYSVLYNDALVSLFNPSGEKFSFQGVDNESLNLDKCI